MKIIIEPAVGHRNRDLGFSNVYVQTEDGGFQIPVGTFNHGEGAEIEIEVTVNDKNARVEVEVQ